MMDNNKFEIRIQVATQYVDDQSEPAIDRYVFAYTITIENVSDFPAQLMSRHWIITDANGKVQEVSGDGVVGEQPKLGPGETYRYSSGAVLETPVGAMQGRYRMQTDDGIDFDAPIPPFTLAVPGTLH
ncbi:MAG: Co2+/Mg2+ efflux protein ApaG [Woeseiaceae bacterium]